MKPSEYLFIKNELNKKHKRLKERFSTVSFLSLVIGIGFFAEYLRTHNENMWFIGILMLVTTIILKTGSLYVEDQSTTKKEKELDKMYNARHLDENSFEEAIKKLGLA